MMVSCDLYFEPIPNRFLAFEIHYSYAITALRRQSRSAGWETE